MSHWARPLIGLPYVPGARGPDAFDCIGLVRYCFEHHRGIELPAYALGESTPRELLRFVKATGWRRTQLAEAKDWDIMTMDNFAGRHIGVVVESSEGLGLLHAEGNASSGSVRWQPLNTLFAYTHKELWRQP